MAPDGYHLFTSKGGALRLNRTVGADMQKFQDFPAFLSMAFSSESDLFFVAQETGIILVYSIRDLSEPIDRFKVQGRLSELVLDDKRQQLIGIRHGADGSLTNRNGHPAGNLVQIDVAPIIQLRGPS